MRRPRRRQGVATLEFALVLPVLLLVIFGALEYAWLFTTRMVLVDAVADGARAGGTARDWLGEDPLVLARSATARAFWPFALPEDAVQAEVLAATATLPRRVRVEISALRYRPLVGYLPDSLLPDQLRAAALAVYP